MGGAFVLKRGKAQHHVMPDFSILPINTIADLKNWLVFFDVSAPLVGVGTLITSDRDGLDLRPQHFHTFSHHGDGGHFYMDTTPADVEYEAYFNIGQRVIRIDRPNKFVSQLYQCGW